MSNFPQKLVRAKILQGIWSLLFHLTLLNLFISIIIKILIEEVLLLSFLYGVLLFKNRDCSSSYLNQNV